ncbi:MAG TPA: hypothetical protein VJ785_06645, partial [Anaerolineales bacterium]|nr:hypothetical protein [Anaerolineales bacterium]
MIRKTFPAIVFMLFTAACMLLTPTADGTATPSALDNAATQTAAALPTATALVPSPTTTVEPLPVPAETVTSTPEESPQAESQFIAYISFGHLLVTDVTNEVQGGTTQYSVAGQSDQVLDLAWSPSGEFVAFVSAAQSEPHIFYVFAQGASSPTDLGPGTAIAWSPDNQSI